MLNKYLFNERLTNQRVMEGLKTWKRNEGLFWSICRKNAQWMMKAALGKKDKWAPGGLSNNYASRALTGTVPQETVLREAYFMPFIFI